jgi:sphingosine kinase
MNARITFDGKTLSGKSILEEKSNSLKILNTSKKVIGCIDIDSIIGYNIVEDDDEISIKIHYMRYVNDAIEITYKNINILYSKLNKQKKSDIEDEWGVINLEPLNDNDIPKNTLPLNKASSNSIVDEPYNWIHIIDNKLKFNTIPRKFIIVLNTFAGKNQANHIYQYTVKPILSNLDIKFLTIETLTPCINENMFDHDMYECCYEYKHSNTVTKNLHEIEDIDSYTSIIAIGGDGTLHAIYNSLYKLDKLNVPVSVISTGSGNGIAKCVTKFHSLDESPTPMQCLFRILTGKKRVLSLSYCTQEKEKEKEKEEKQCVSILSQSWGLPSDVDIGSEFMRSIPLLGNNRFTIMTIYRMLNLYTYKGSIDYLPVNEENKKQIHKYSKLDIHDELDETWKRISGEFIMVWGCQMPWMASDMNVSPRSSFDDDKIVLFIIKKGISRIELLKIFMNLEKGEHITHPNVITHDVYGYRLTPDVTSKSYIVIDGELVKQSTLQVITGSYGFIYC